MNNRAEKVCEIQKKLNNKWADLQKMFYICYSVKEVAYKVAYELLETLYGEYDNAIFCKAEKDKWTIAIYFEQDIYFYFDIWWKTGMYGDTGLNIGGANIKGKLLEGFEDIDYVLEDFEEE